MLVSTMYAQSDERVRRGYRLHVTNLEDRSFTYTVKYWVTPPTPEPRWAAALNQFFTLYAGLYGAGTDNSIQGFSRTGSIYVATMSFVLEAKHTVPVGITPNLANTKLDGPYLLEGYVTLEVPVVRPGRGEESFRAQPQSDGPVKVLLNPETTMVHRDPDGVGVTLNLNGEVTGEISRTRLNFDTVESLVPASGKAANEIMPNGILVLTHDTLQDALHSISRLETGARAGSENLPAADRIRTLIELLCELDTKKEFLAQLNKILGKNHAAARICPR
jgi:hypothetical protein